MEQFSDSISSDDEDVLNFFQPSISDEIHVGYCNKDYASQTDVTEILELKKVSEWLFVLVRDITNLKKSFYYAKLTLQAEYSSQLQNAVVELHTDTNKKLFDLQLRHQEHVKTVRRSFKTQLANAICKLSKDHLFYSKKEGSDHNDTYNSTNEIKEKKKESVLMIKEMDNKLENMMKLKAEIEEDIAVESIEIPSLYPEKLTSELMQQENNTLKEYIKDLESKLEDLEETLEKTSDEKIILRSEINRLSNSLQEEKEKVSELLAKLSIQQKELLKEQNLAEAKLTEQKLKFTSEMENQIQIACEAVRAQMNERISSFKKIEVEKLHLQKQHEELMLKKMQETHKELNPTLFTTLSRFDKAHFEHIVNEQHLEIKRLKKDLALNKKMWSLKVKTLQQQIHALKDEMFLRTTLRRQTIKMRQVSVSLKTSSKSESASIGNQNCMEMINNQSRKYCFPAIIQPPFSKFNNDLIASGFSF